MTLDPDDYDLRELRRIADERRNGRRSGGADRSGDEGQRRTDSRRRRRHADAARRNGGGPHRSGRSAERSEDGQHRRESPKEPDAGEVTVRPRTGSNRSQRDDDAGVRDTNARSQDGDTVVHADRAARDLGFGNGHGRPEQQRGQRPRRGAVEHSHADQSDNVGRFQFDTAVRERTGSRPGAALREGHLEHLLVQETAASDLSKPYLTGLPDAYAAERLLFDWLEFLVLKGGFKRAMDALRYYRTVGWVTAEVEADLRDYLVGFSGEVSDADAYDVDDHHLSLVYIARLATMT